MKRKGERAPAREAQVVVGVDKDLHVEHGADALHVQHQNPFHDDHVSGLHVAHGRAALVRRKVVDGHLHRLHALRARACTRAAAGCQPLPAIVG